MVAREPPCRPEVTGMTRALIIGGGVAGPVAAMALQKAGIDSTVHEAYPAPAHDVGAWLGLQTNGLDALRAIDAEQSVLGVGFPTPWIEFRSWTGKVLGCVSTSSSQAGGTVGLSMKRSELYRALHAEAVRRGIDIRYGSRLVAARNTHHGGTPVPAAGTTGFTGLLVGGGAGRPPGPSRGGAGLRAARVRPGPEPRRLLRARAGRRRAGPTHDGLRQARFLRIPRAADGQDRVVRHPADVPGTGGRGRR